MPYTLETDVQHVAGPETKVLDKKDGVMTVPRILLADDQEEMLRTIVLMLQDEFQIVGTAEDGLSVVELTRRLAPDVIILDISMPIVDGLEAAWRVRDSGLPAKVIFLTVHEDPDFVEAAMSAGALGYVLKPYLATDLVPAIWTVLQGHPFVSSSSHLH